MTRTRRSVVDGGEAEGGEEAVMRRVALLVFVLGVVLAAISAYGWWFHFSVGPSHGAGLEIGIMAGQMALVAFIAAVWLDRRGL